MVSSMSNTPKRLYPSEVWEVDGMWLVKNTEGNYMSMVSGDGVAKAMNNSRFFGDSTMLGKVTDAKLKLLSHLVSQS